MNHKRGYRQYLAARSKNGIDPSVLSSIQNPDGREGNKRIYARTRQHRYKPIQSLPLQELKGTTFFGGAGMDQKYIEDMLVAFNEFGIKNSRAASVGKWSNGSMFLDAPDTLIENSRDSRMSDFSDFESEGKQFNLIGYSYGGTQAAQAAIDAADIGEQVDNLVLIGTPLEQDFLDQLEEHPNIANIHILDIDQYGDPLKAGMNDIEIVESVPTLIRQIMTKDPENDGHFYYSNESAVGDIRRRILANKLVKLGLE